MGRREKNTEGRARADIAERANGLRKSFFAEQTEMITTKLKIGGAPKEDIQKIRKFIAEGASITDDGW